MKRALAIWARTPTLGYLVILVPSMKNIGRVVPRIRTLS